MTPNLDSLLVDQMAEALIYADREGFIRRWNAGAEAIFGFTSGEALGKSLDLIIPERLREAHWRGFDAALAQGTAQHGRVSRITKALTRTGDTIYVDMSFAVVCDEAGAAIGSVAVAQEASARYREEQTLRRRLAAQEATGQAGEV